MLRRCFERWGMPGRIRVDNGAPWGNTHRDVPSPLSLWLIGLDVEVVWNRPRHPTDNGVVERGQGVVQQWVEVACCRSLAELERWLAWAVEMQREKYPACNGKSRMASYPELAHSGRSYETAREAQMWDIKRVHYRLSQGIWARKVDKVGYISLYNYAYSVGRPYQGQTVYVQFDGETGEWVVRDGQGNEIKRFQARGIETDAIRHLSVSRVKRRNRCKKSP